MPLISISATQCMGKTTLLNDFRKNWPMYNTPIKTYRDILKSKNLPNNDKTTPDTQEAILDSMIESQKPYNRERDNVIFDRCPLDALVYTLWAYAKGIDGFTDDFMDSYIKRVRTAIKDFDIMFYIPMTKYNPELEEKELRSIDPVYREEIDNFFKNLVQAQQQEDDVFFDRSDCGPIIEIFGNREERIEMIKLYLNQKGNFFGEEDNLLVNALGQELNPDVEVDYLPPSIEDFKIGGDDK
jgi:hypothetical protein